MLWAEWYLAAWMLIEDTALLPSIRLGHGAEAASMPGHRGAKTWRRSSAKGCSSCRHRWRPQHLQAANRSLQ